MCWAFIFFFHLMAKDRETWDSTSKSQFTSRAGTRILVVQLHAQGTHIPAVTHVHSSPQPSKWPPGTTNPEPTHSHTAQVPCTPSPCPPLASRLHLTPAQSRAASSAQNTLPTRHASAQSTNCQSPSLVSAPGESWQGSYLISLSCFIFGVFFFFTN